MLPDMVQSLFSVDQVKKIYGNLNSGCSISTIDTKRIVSAARQSDDYFKAAGSCNTTIKPLLLYYGVMNLSYSYLKLTDSRSDPGSGHGLSLNKKEKLDENCLVEACRSIENLELSFPRGFFKTFAEKTKNRSISNSIGIKIEEGFIDYKNPTLEEVSFIEILSRDSNIRSRSHHNKCFHLIGCKVEHSHMYIKFRSKPSDDFIRHYIGKGFKFNEAENEFDSTEEIFQKNPFQISQHFDTPTRIPALFATYPVNNDQYLSQKLNLYIISYVMGMLSRYYPTVWQTMVSGNTGDEIWPLLLNAQNVIFHHYPTIIANEIKTLYDG